MPRFSWWDDETLLDGDDDSTVPVEDLADMNLIPGYRVSADGTELVWLHNEHYRYPLLEKLNELYDDHDDSGTGSDSTTDSEYGSVDVEGTNLQIRSNNWPPQCFARSLLWLRNVLVRESDLETSKPTKAQSGHFEDKYLGQVGYADWLEKTELCQTGDKTYYDGEEGLEEAINDIWDCDTGCHICYWEYSSDEEEEDEESEDEDDDSRHNVGFVHMTGGSEAGFFDANFGVYSVDSQDALKDILIETIERNYYVNDYFRMYVVKVQEEE